MSQAGVAVAAITAKDKLRRMLGSGLDIGPGQQTAALLLVEQADRCTLEEHGIDGVEALVGRAKPDMYSADLSLFVLDAGIRLVEQGRARAALPVAVRLRAARPCAGRARGARLSPRARRPARAARGARLRRRRSPPITA